ncbi:hypothetical protein D3C72_2530790 [compost metagenome]
MVGDVQRAGQGQVAAHIEQRVGRGAAQRHVDPAGVVQGKVAAYLQRAALRALQHAARQRDILANGAGA